VNVEIPEILNEVPTILVPLIPLPIKLPSTLNPEEVIIPVKYPSPVTQSFDVGFVVPIPILKFSFPTNQYLEGLASVLTPTAN
jgi:hypothetical protein